jgi:hypothetical protein
MSRLDHVVCALIDDLTALRRTFALVGGLAVSVRTEERFTRDVDVVIAVDDDRDGEALVRDLVARGYGVLQVLEHETAHRLATVRLRSAVDPAVVADVLFASSGIEHEIVAAAQPLDVGGSACPVARSGHLVAMKLLSVDDVRRPQDRVDLARLLAGSSSDEIARAREAVALIVARGMNRERDLVGQLETAIETYRAP